MTLQEFADLQCPICQAYTQDSLPTLINTYVRPGKVKMIFHHLAQLRADTALSDKYGFSGTSSFLLSKTGGTPSPLSQVDVTSPSSFTGPINSLLGQ